MLSHVLRHWPSTFQWRALLLFFFFYRKNSSICLTSNPLATTSYTFQINEMDLKHINSELYDQLPECLANNIHTLFYVYVIHIKLVFEVGEPEPKWTESSRIGCVPFVLFLRIGCVGRGHNVEIVFFPHSSLSTQPLRSTARGWDSSDESDICWKTVMIAAFKLISFDWSIRRKNGSHHWNQQFHTVRLELTGFFFSFIFVTTKSRWVSGEIIEFELPAAITILTQNILLWEPSADAYCSMVTNRIIIILSSYLAAVAAASLFCFKLSDLKVRSVDLELIRIPSFHGVFIANFLFEWNSITTRCSHIVIICLIQHIHHISKLSVFSYIWSMNFTQWNIMMSLRRRANLMREWFDIVLRISEAGICFIEIGNVRVCAIHRENRDVTIYSNTAGGKLWTSPKFFSRCRPKNRSTQTRKKFAHLVQPWNGLPSLTWRLATTECEHSNFSPFFCLCVLRFDVQQCRKYKKKVTDHIYRLFLNSQQNWQTEFKKKWRIQTNSILAFSGKASV